MSSLYNRARVATATTGTGTMTLGAATSAAFFTFAEAGVPDGTVVSYVIEDGTNVEIGIGTYTSSGTTLSRTTVTASKIGGTAGTTKLTLSGSAVVYIAALAADITVPPASSTDKAIPRFSGTTGRAIQNNLQWTIDDNGNMVGSNSINGDLNLTIDNTSTGASARTLVNFLVGDDTRAGFSFISDHTANSNYIYSNHGSLLYGTQSDNSMFFVTNNSIRGVIRNDGFIGFGTAYGAVYNPSVQLEASYDSAATNTVSQVLGIISTSTGTPANGIGAGMQFGVETAANVIKTGATVEAYAWDVTPGSEDFSLVFRTMSAGAAATEEGRAGFMPVALVQNDNINMRANYGMVVPEAYEIASGIALDIGAGGILEITA